MGRRDAVLLTLSFAWGCADFANATLGSDAWDGALPDDAGHVTADSGDGSRPSRRELARQDAANRAEHDGSAGGPGAEHAASEGDAGAALKPDAGACCPLKEALFGASGSCSEFLCEAFPTPPPPGR